MQLREAHGQFQVQLRADGRSEHTRKQYARHIIALIAWLTAAKRTTKIEAITPAIVAEFFASDAAGTSARGGKKKATSANAQRTSLRCFFRWAHEWGLTKTNAARLLKRARCAPPPPRAVRDDEQRRLLGVLATAVGDAAERDRMLISLLLHCGLRLGSAIGLDVGDVDLEHHELNVRKAKGDRPTVVIVPKTVTEELRAFMRGRSAGPLFCAGPRRVSMRHAQRRISGWFAAAGIRGHSAHGLRHAFAMRVYDRTGDLLTTQLALHHSSITSTCVYARTDMARLRTALGA